MSRDRIQLAGPVFSIVTPFIEGSGDVDWKALERYVEYAYQGGARAFYVMAYNSRYSQLSDREILELNAFVIRAVKELDAANICIVGDPLHCSSEVSAAFARHAQEAGAEMISLIVRERYFFDDQIYNHYKYVADHSEIGILIHEMPFHSGLGGPPVNWPLSLLDRVGDIPAVMAIKEDAKEDEYSREVISLLRDRLSIVISGGGKDQWLRFAPQGCQAWLNGIGVFEPRLASAFWENYRAGNSERVRGLLKEVEEPFFREGVHRYGWHLTIKAALEARGHMSRQERLPMQALPQALADRIRELVEGLPIGRYTRPGSGSAS